MKVRLRWRLAATGAAALVLSAIFQFSAQSSQDSNGLSLRLAQTILELFGVRSYEALHILNLILRKAAHFSIYFILGCFLAVIIGNGRKPFWEILLCAGIGAVLAAFDEGHQSFSAGRTPSVWDVLLDSCGVVAGSGMMVRLSNRWKRGR